MHRFFIAGILMNFSRVPHSYTHTFVYLIGSASLGVPWGSPLGQEMIAASYARQHLVLQCPLRAPPPPSTPQWTVAAVMLLRGPVECVMFSARSLTATMAHGRLIRCSPWGDLAVQKPLGHRHHKAHSQHCWLPDTPSPISRSTIAQQMPHLPHLNEDMMLPRKQRIWRVHLLKWNLPMWKWG